MMIRLNNALIFIILKYVIIKAVCFSGLSWTSTGSSQWEMFLENYLNQKTLKLYITWMHWKKQCRLTIRKHALSWNKHEYQHYPDKFVKNIFNPFHGTGVFVYPLKYIRKPEVSWCIQGTLKETIKSHLILKTHSLMFY